MEAEYIKEERYPQDARPSAGRPLETINVYDKYKRGVRLSPHERYEFSAVCKLGADQIIDCYGPLCYKDTHKSVFDFLARCSECPYVRSRMILPYEAIIDSSQTFDALRVADAVDHCCDYETPKCFVYFVGDGRLVKVGKAKDIKRRLGSMQTASAVKLTVLALIPCADEASALNAEQILHSRFSNYRVSGEWFNIYDGVCNYFRDDDTHNISKCFDPDIYLKGG